MRIHRKHFQPNVTATCGVCVFEGGVKGRFYDEARRLCQGNASCHVGLLSAIIRPFDECSVPLLWRVGMG